MFSSLAQPPIDPMALDEADSDDDDEKRASFEEDSSDEDLDSAVNICQQPEPAAVIQQQDDVENMDISSTDG